jgi:spore germination cell wall hydrolase CwlJ-like protein
MKLAVRLPALSAACALLLLAITPVGPVMADTGTTADRSMSRDNPSRLRSTIGELFGLRPRPRDEAAVTDAAEPLDGATLDAMPAASGGDDWRCLAEAIYFESRGEPLDGQVAVAEVVLNRVEDGRFPRTVCGVTNQGAGSGAGCQFSYACDGRSDAMKSTNARIRAEKIAALMLAGHPRARTDGATYFHTRSVRPGWAHRMTRTASIGHHYFYRASTQVASN